MLRARHAMDRDVAAPLDIAALARLTHLAPAHFTPPLPATPPGLPSAGPDHGEQFRTSTARRRVGGV